VLARRFGSLRLALIGLFHEESAVFWMGGHGVAKIAEEFSTRHNELKLIVSAIRAAAVESTAAGEERNERRRKRNAYPRECTAPANAMAI
jgi:hypothetical protein